MRRAYDDKEPCSCLLVEVDPGILRNIANRIEYKISISNPGQTITLKLTEEITLFTNVSSCTRENK